MPRRWQQGGREARTRMSTVDLGKTTRAGVTSRRQVTRGIDRYRLIEDEYERKVVRGRACGGRSRQTCLEAWASRVEDTKTTSMHAKTGAWTGGTRSGQTTAPLDKVKWQRGRRGKWQGGGGRAKRRGIDGDEETRRARERRQKEEADGLDGWVGRWMDEEGRGEERRGEEMGITDGRPRLGSEGLWTLRAEMQGSRQAGQAEQRDKEKRCEVRPYLRSRRCEVRQGEVEESAGVGR
ncbi:hypothetical protein LY76DRAFT_162891 [Colletotrichum caudatum]|nr:hypothetical protein LY76DRAFT_162891 [Colletotrichum caudatum]